MLFPPLEPSASSPAIGYTGLDGNGLTAEDVLQGRPISNSFVNVSGESIYTSYEGLKSLLEYIDNNIVTYSNNVTQQGTISIGGNNVAFNAFNTGPDADGLYPPFIFTGSLLDLIPSNSSAYTNIYNQLYSIIAPLLSDNNGGGDPIDIDPAILLSVVNNLVNESIDFEKHQQGVLFRSAVFERASTTPGAPPPSFTPVFAQDLSAGNSVGNSSSDEYTRLGSFSFDSNDDGTIGSADLLDFLAYFSASDPRRKIVDALEAIQNLLSDFRFKKLEATGFNTFHNIIPSNAFINLLIESLSPLEQNLPPGLSFGFDDDPTSETYNQIITVGDAF